MSHIGPRVDPGHPLWSVPTNRTLLPLTGRTAAGIAWRATIQGDPDGWVRIVRLDVGHRDLAEVVDPVKRRTIAAPRQAVTLEDVAEAWAAAEAHRLDVDATREFVARLAGEIGDDDNMAIRRLPPTTRVVAEVYLSFLSRGFRDPTERTRRALGLER